MTQKLIGRIKEQSVLRQIYKSAKSEFLAIYGRRRVGKTFLIKNFFEDESCMFFYCSGIKDGKRVEQLEEFAKQIGNTFYDGAAIASRDRWRDAFDDLNKAIERIPSGKKVVIFFDELPWMATPRSGLLQAIDYNWNRYWSHDKRIKLIVCGSSASWIIEKIINNKGGLYNRVTRTIHLEPFTLCEVKEFLLSLGIKLNHQQIIDLYMVLGGIPHYLNLINKGLSAVQCIDELCFQKNGALVNEFERLFSSLFSDAETYINLIRHIAEFRYGIGQAQLIKKSNISGGGWIQRKLNELQQAGFIAEFIPHGHRDKGIYYKVIDEFTLFYLRWIEPNLRTISKQDQASGYWLSKIKAPASRSWSGLAFEAVCYKHLSQIRKALRIEPGSEVGSWRHVPRNQEEPGAQIDLLFDRDDGAITICEIKYNEQPFKVDKEYSKKLLNKVNVYKKQRRVDKQAFLVMITANGLSPSMYSEEMIDGVVILDDLFAQV